MTYQWNLLQVGIYVINMVKSYFIDIIETLAVRHNTHSNSRAPDKRSTLYARRFFALALTAGNNKLITCHRFVFTEHIMVRRCSDEEQTSHSLANIAIKMHIILWIILCNLLIYLLLTLRLHMVCSVYLPQFFFLYIFENAFAYNSKWKM